MTTPETPVAGATTETAKPVEATLPTATLTGKKTLTIAAPKTIAVDKLTLMRYVVDVTNKKIMGMTKEIGPVVLWEGADYDNVVATLGIDKLATERLLTLYNK